MEKITYLATFTLNLSNGGIIFAESLVEMEKIVDAIGIEMLRNILSLRFEGKIIFINIIALPIG